MLEKSLLTRPLIRYVIGRANHLHRTLHLGCSTNTFLRRVRANNRVVEYPIRSSHLGVCCASADICTMTRRACSSSLTVVSALVERVSQITWSWSDVGQAPQTHVDSQVPLSHKLLHCANNSLISAPRCTTPSFRVKRSPSLGKRPFRWPACHT